MTLIACEVFENGICSLLSALVQEGQEATAPLPPNLRLWTEDARSLLRDLPDACLDKLFLFFPILGQKPGTPSGASCMQPFCRFWRAS